VDLHGGDGRFIEDDELSLLGLRGKSLERFVDGCGGRRGVDRNAGDNRIIGEPRKLCDPQIWEPPSAQ